MIKYLSYPVKDKIPAYGCAEAGIKISNVKSLKTGDSCNTFRFSMENHWGTHIDCPAHFFAKGMKAADYPPETWIFKKPFVCEIKATDNQIITSEQIGNIFNGADLLIVKSGFYSLRGTEKYWKNNPGFDPDVGRWLRTKHPHLRAIGFDFISLSPYQNRELGRKAHKAFLDPDGNSAPIFIIEDMDLSHDLSRLAEVWTSPWRLEGIDSAPCTVIGFFE